jgi:hypothetical protein
MTGAAGDKDAVPQAKRRPILHQDPQRNAELWAHIDEEQARFEKNKDQIVYLAARAVADYILSTREVAKKGPAALATEGGSDASGR